jgi:soluble calcium-activated nucleotidase 1
MKKASSFNVLLNEGALQSRWRQNTGASFIRIRKNYKFRSQFIYLVLIVLIFLIVYIIMPTNRHLIRYNTIYEPLNKSPSIVKYNATYPLTVPIINVQKKVTIYKIGMIADLDTNSRKSKNDNVYTSYFKKGHLTVSSSHSSFEFMWTADTKEITSGYSLKGKILHHHEIIIKY